MTRKIRIRHKLRSRSQRPRLSVFRSNKKIYAQIIDDIKGETLVSASEADIKSKQSLSKTQQAQLVGKNLAQKALKKKLKQVVFDRGQYQYHGRVKALAQGARDQGLSF